MNNHFDGTAERTAHSAATDVFRPARCPDCGARALDTLAKIITADTYWRCVTCGLVWNRKQRRG